MVKIIIVTIIDILIGIRISSIAIDHVIEIFIFMKVLLKDKKLVSQSLLFLKRITSCRYSKSQYFVKFFYVSR